VVGGYVLVYARTHTQATWVLDVSPGVGWTPGESGESRSTKAQYTCRPYISWAVTSAIRHQLRVDCAVRGPGLKALQMFVRAAGPVRAANSAEGESLGAAHKGWGHDRIHLTNELWRNLLEGLRRVGASEGHSYGVSMRDGRCQHCVKCFVLHCSCEHEIRRFWGSMHSEIEGHCCQGLWLGDQV